MWYEPNRRLLKVPWLKVPLGSLCEPGATCLLISLPLYIRCQWRSTLHGFAPSVLPPQWPPPRLHGWLWSGAKVTSAHKDVCTSDYGEALASQMIHDQSWGWHWHLAPSRSYGEVVRRLCAGACVANGSTSKVCSANFMRLLKWCFIHTACTLSKRHAIYGPYAACLGPPQTPMHTLRCILASLPFI